jgi:hypothetical protein
MKNQKFDKINDQINNDQVFTNLSNNIKTTNINILLNRVRQEKKIQSKKKIFLSLTIIAILFFTSIIVFTN